ncbi:hypothetical protein CRUP_005859 [Coryphaenoides rupestris]|nr:hypothetical protein CRUP_005859 [Coryphaenoides rupestris]
MTLLPVLDGEIQNTAAPTPDRQADTQTDTQTDRQAGRQTDREERRRSRPVTDTQYSNLASTPATRQTSLSRTMSATKPTRDDGPGGSSGGTWYRGGEEEEDDDCCERKNGLFGSGIGIGSGSGIGIGIANTPSRYGELRDDGPGDLDPPPFHHPYQDDVKRPAVAMETASTDGEIQNTAAPTPDRQADTQTDTQTDRQAGRQTDREERRRSRPVTDTQYSNLASTPATRQTSLSRTMSATKPTRDDGPGGSSGGTWYGGGEEEEDDDCCERKNGLFGSGIGIGSGSGIGIGIANTPSRYGELRDDGPGDLDPPPFHHPYQDDVKRPAVAMETASTDDLMSGLFRKPMSDDSDLYTSLLSNQNFPTSQEASYLSDDLKPGKTSSGSSSHQLFSSYTSSSSKTPSYMEEDLPRSLLGSDKTESYNYMDISHGDDLLSQRPDPLASLTDIKVSLTPVKITLTQSKTPAAEPESQPPPRSSPLGGSDNENVLSVGMQGVPTNSAATAAASKEPEASSNESGDSEIELVSEEPLLSQTSPGTKASSGPFAQPPVSKSPVTPPGNPFDLPPAAKGGFGLTGNHAAPATYSILREEREAELDSELFIESAPSTSRLLWCPPPPAAAAATATATATATTPAHLEEKKPAEPPVKTPPGAEAVKAPAVKMQEEDRPSKPKPPTAAVPPEVRSAEKPPPQEDAGSKMEAGGEVMGDMGKPPGATFLQNFDKQKAIDLLYWRNIKQSGAVFSSVLLLLFSLTQFSVVSVGAYLALAALSATISFRIYKSVLQAVQKTDEGHPFKSFLEVEIALSQDQIGKYADKIMLYSNTCMKELRRLFLFAVLMWLLTYVGALFNGLTLLILVVISMFTMPVVYEKHQAQIDQYVGLIRTQVNSVVGKIQAKIPGAKRKEE